VRVAKRGVLSIKSFESSFIWHPELTIDLNLHLRLLLIPGHS
jgi:hypothetical protein